MIVGDVFHTCRLQQLATPWKRTRPNPGYLWNGWRKIQQIGQQHIISAKKGIGTTMQQLSSIDNGAEILLTFRIPTPFRRLVLWKVATEMKFCDYWSRFSKFLGQWRVPYLIMTTCTSTRVQILCLFDPAQVAPPLCMLQDNHFKLKVLSVGIYDVIVG
jgi:hypothetical protein